MGRVNQLQEDAAGALRVHEDVSVAASAGLDFIRNQPNAVSFESFNRGGQVRHPQANMMQAFTALRDEFGDG